MTLKPDRFPEFFQAVHGHRPFPWQKRLLREVLASGWPATLSLPTASGKTAIMDVAVYALACQAAARTAPRTMASRIARFTMESLCVPGPASSAPSALIILPIRPRALTNAVEHPSGRSASTSARQLRIPIPAPAMYGDHEASVRKPNITIHSLQL
jgi:hypothetical protein